jgi:hypothetical protein
MKIKNKLSLILSSLAMMFVFTSCLNDEAVENQEYGLIDLNANKIIEIPAGGNHTADITTLDEGVKIFKQEVRLAAEKPAQEDIVVHLEIVSDRNTVLAAVRELLSDKYPKEGDNAVADEDIYTYPVSSISVPATVTIPKGARSVELPISIDTHLLTPEIQFALIRIKSVENDGYIISGNFGQLLLNMKLKHKYAGRYALTGTMDHLPSPGAYVHITNYPGMNPFPVQLQTLDGKSIVMFDEVGFGDYIYPMMTATGGFSGWGSFAPVFTFDDAGNITAVTNLYGQPAGNSRSAELDPSGVNKYDEATKSFQVSYWMNQPSVVTTPPHHRCHMVETYTFIEDL